MRNWGDFCAEHRDEHKCASVGNLYFEDSDPTILQVYDSQPLKEPDGVFKVSLHNPDTPIRYEDGEQTMTQAPFEQGQTMEMGGF